MIDDQSMKFITEGKVKLRNNNGEKRLLTTTTTFLIRSSLIGAASYEMGQTLKDSPQLERYNLSASFSTRNT